MNFLLDYDFDPQIVISSPRSSKLVITSKTLYCLNELKEYLITDRSAVKRVWSIQFQDYNYISINTTLLIQHLNLCSLK